VPQAWVSEDADFDTKLAVDLNRYIGNGLLHEHLSALERALKAMFNFVDVWFDGHRPTRDLEDEATLQNVLRDHLRAHNLSVSEGSKLGGGALDLAVEDVILIENKFHGVTKQPSGVKKAAAMQGRRYAISLGSQIVIVVLGYRPAAGSYPRKVDVVQVRKIADENRAEIRFSMPYGSVAPHDEKVAPL
jgi:hypothetical protein